MYHSIFIYAHATLELHMCVMYNYSFIHLINVCVSEMHFKGMNQKYSGIASTYRLNKILPSNFMQILQFLWYRKYLIPYTCICKSESNTYPLFNRSRTGNGTYWNFRKPMSSFRLSFTTCLQI